MIVCPLVPFTSYPSLHLWLSHCSFKTVLVPHSECQPEVDIVYSMTIVCSHLDLEDHVAVARVSFQIGSFQGKGGAGSQSACPCKWGAPRTGVWMKSCNHHHMYNWAVRCDRQAPGGEQEDQPEPECAGQRDQRPHRHPGRPCARAVPRLQAHAHLGGLAGRQLQNHPCCHHLPRARGLWRCVRPNA